MKKSQVRQFVKEQILAILLEDSPIVEPLGGEGTKDFLKITKTDDLGGLRILVSTGSGKQYIDILTDHIPILIQALGKVK